MELTIERCFISWIDTKIYTGHMGILKAPKRIIKQLAHNGYYNLIIKGKRIISIQPQVECEYCN